MVCLSLGGSDSWKHAGHKAQEEDEDRGREHGDQRWWGGRHGWRWK